MKRIIILMVAGLALASGVALAGDAGVSADVATTADAAVNAAASTDIDVGGDPVGFFKSTYDAAKSGQWWMLVSMIVMALVWGARKWAKKIAWFKTDRGGACLAMGIGILGGMAHGILAEGAPTLGMLTESIKVTVGAMGGYVAIKKSLFPSDKKNGTTPAEA